MPSIDLDPEATQLRSLGDDFERLHSKVLHLRLNPGADARQKISPLIVSTNALVDRALLRLDALANSQYSAVPGSRPSLEALASVVHAATTAAGNLVHALNDNPAGGAPYGGSPTDPDTRYEAASTAIPGHLTEAAHQLHLAFTGCYHLARGISRDLQQTPGQQPSVPAPKLSAGQHEALVRLSSGGGQTFSGVRSANPRTLDGNGRTINQATLRVLIKHKLVMVDTSTSLFVGRRLTVTEAGRQAITAYKPSPSALRSAVPPAISTARRTR